MGDADELWPKDLEVSYKQPSWRAAAQGSAAGPVAAGSGEPAERQGGPQDEALAGRRWRRTR